MPSLSKLLGFVLLSTAAGSLRGDVSGPMTGTGMTNMNQMDGCVLFLPTIWSCQDVSLLVWNDSSNMFVSMSFNSKSDMERYKRAAKRKNIRKRSKGKENKNQRRLRVGEEAYKRRITIAAERKKAKEEESAKAALHWEAEAAKAAAKAASPCPAGLGRSVSCALHWEAVAAKMREAAKEEVRNAVWEPNAAARKYGILEYSPKKEARAAAKGCTCAASSLKRKACKYRWTNKNLPCQ